MDYSKVSFEDFESGFIERPSISITPLNHAELTPLTHTELSQGI
jgi:hypothetical protein